jgi:hypothetical protein
VSDCPARESLDGRELRALSASPWQLSPCAQDGPGWRGVSVRISPLPAHNKQLQQLTHGRVLLAHPCHPRYSGSRDQEDHGSKPAPANSSRDPISKKNPSQKRAAGVARGVDPEFQPNIKEPCRVVCAPVACPCSACWGSAKCPGHPHTPARAHTGHGAQHCQSSWRAGRSSSCVPRSVGEETSLKRRKGS